MIILQKLWQHLVFEKPWIYFELWKALKHVLLGLSPYFHYLGRELANLTNTRLSGVKKHEIVLARARSVQHCNENPIYVFLFWELRGLSPNLHIHVSMSDLYIPRIGLHISCSRIGRLIVGIYKSLTDTWMWKLGLWPRKYFSGNICFKFSVLVLCSENYAYISSWIDCGTTAIFVSALQNKIKGSPSCPQRSKTCFFYFSPIFAFPLAIKEPYNQTDRERLTCIWQCTITYRAQWIGFLHSRLCLVKASFGHIPSLEQSKRDHLLFLWHDNI